jgi:benzylsuccinate CoA-transferase BbsF subunit
MNNQPLKGVRVADFGWVLAVPHATAWLGILGADVVRVESAARVDIVRASGLRAGADGIPGLNRSSMFNGLNYNKRSITLNLADPHGVEIAKQLIAMSDVVTENFAAGVFEKFGLGYETLRAIKPDIVMLSGSPLGQSGPDRNATGWGPNTQAYAGLPFITGYEGGPPSGIGGYYPDYMIGVAMAFSLLAALHHRARTGEGQLIEVAMAETVATMIPEAIIEYTMNGCETPRRGNSDPAMCPHGVYRCNGDDTWVAIAVAGDAQWEALRGVVGDPPWSRDPSYATIAGRQAAREAIERGLTEWTRQRTHYEVMHALQRVGIAAGPSTDVVELLADPHLAERGLFIAPDHPEVGPRSMVGMPGRYSAVPEWNIQPSPLLGQHNREVYLGLLGLSESDFANLVEAKVIF